MKCHRSPQQAQESAVQPTRGPTSLRRLARVGLGAGALLAAIAVYNEIQARRAPVLAPQLEGGRHRFPWRTGEVVYTVLGSGPPLLLVHDLGIGGSMSQWKHNQAALAASYTVYALDLLGWGESDKPAACGRANDYGDQIARFVEDVIGEPCTIIASGSSCGFAIAAAARLPELVQRIVLVCPLQDNSTVSFGPASSGTASSGKSGALTKSWRDRVCRLFGVPVLGTLVYNLLTSEQGVRDYAGRHVFFDEGMADREWVPMHYAGARQRGAIQAGVASLAGLARWDARREWSGLEISSLLIWGRHAMAEGLEAAPEWLACNIGARLEVVDGAKLAPHFERYEQFNAIVLRWLRDT